MSGIRWILAPAMFLLLTRTEEAQQRPGTTATSNPMERFAGKVTLQGGEEVTVGIHNWIIQPYQKIDSLDLPTKGLLIVQLRGGKLVTIIAGKRQPRRRDEYWTVQAGTSMGLETQDDAAVIQTIAIARPGPRP